MDALVEPNIQGSFVAEFELALDPKALGTLKACFEAARHLYNAVLGEGRKRLRCMRESKGFQRARKLPKGAKRTQQFKTLRKTYGFNEYSLHKYATRLRQSWLGQHVGSTVAQTLATRAFRALEKLAIFKAKRVRFKNKSGLDSLEEKSDTGFRWKKTGVQFKKLFMPAHIDPQDPISAYALTKKVKYVRIVRRRIRDKTRYFAQLVLSGKPLSLRERFLLKGKETCLPKTESKVGLDIGPSTVAIVSEEAASLHVFCGELKRNARVERRLQRKQDRQRRAANPSNYDSKGRALKGRRAWVKTKGYQRTSAKLANEARRTAAHRKSLHGALINQYVPLEGKILMEKISIRSFQKNFGRSVGIRAPGMFIERLKRKAENACGSVEEFSTFATCLSQMCICGMRQKKPLSARMHACVCGAQAQRDLFAAYLACFVQDGRLCVAQAQKAWEGAEPLLHAAHKASFNSTSGGACPSSFGPQPEKSESAEKKSTKPRDKGLDAVVFDLNLKHESQAEFRGCTS